MIHKQLRDSYRKLSERDLDELVAELGRKFPPQYRNLCLDHNGGAFGNSTVICTPAEQFAFNAMIAPRSLFSYDSLADTLAAVDWCEDYLPIADDPGGNLFGIPWDADGPVLLWDHETGNTGYVCDQLSTFVSSAYLAPDREAELRSLGPIEGDIATGDLQRLLGIDPHDLRTFRNADGETALMIAANHGEPFVLRYLLECGCDVHARSPEGKTALHFVAYGHSNDCCRALLSAGAEVDPRDSAGNTPLLVCASLASSHAAYTLIEAGADIDARDLRGDSLESLPNVDWKVLEFARRRSGADSP